MLSTEPVVAQPEHSANTIPLKAATWRMAQTFYATPRLQTIAVLALSKRARRSRNAPKLKR